MKMISFLLMASMMSCLGFDWKISEVDEGISIGDDVAFKELTIPGVMIELALAREIGKEELSGFRNHLSRCIPGSLFFARSAISHNGDEPKEEK